MTADRHPTRVLALPDLGEGLPDAEIVAWRLAVGDLVDVDQVVVEVETAKAAVEVPCPYAGVIAELHGNPGETIPVGAPLVTVLAEPVQDGSGGQPDQRPMVGYGALPAAPPPPAANPGRTRVPVESPLVRRAAREAGVALTEIRGSGPDGLITRADVEAAARAAGYRSSSPSLAPSPEPPGGRRLRSSRRAVARNLLLSRHEIPDATCWLEVDATGLLAARAALANGPVGIGVTALLARVTVAALRANPQLNARFDADRAEPVLIPEVHLGVAVQTDAGLRVPVLRDADRYPTEALAERLSRLTADARAGRLTPAELTGSTFTLNNYGVYKVDAAAPILNYPEAGMLGVGQVARRPWVVGDEIVPRSVARLSVTFDHRVCDGADAARFLTWVAGCVEQPVRLLRST